MHNKNKVTRYYAKFQEASEELQTFIDLTGIYLEDAGFISDASEFRESLEGRLTAIETARLQFERVVREEQVGVGPVTVSNRVTVDYDGEYLYNNLDPETRDRVVKLEYRVNPTEFKKLAASGEIKATQVEEAVLARKESVVLKGTPPKVGLG